MREAGAWLLSARLERVASRIEAATKDEERAALWAEADQALVEAGAEEDADTALPVMERDLGAVRLLLEGWASGRTPLPEWDKAVLRRAMNAFKKRLKLTRLDDVSTAAGNPLSSGRRSSIVGIRPPEQYPPEVWTTLVRQGRLRDAGGGHLEPAAP